MRYFLEQCIRSVELASKHIETEIIVVDNASVDDSVAVVQKQFPHVKLVASPKNLGFSAGNNIGIEMATGRHILLLNPDTLVPEDCFDRCLAFVEAHPDCGALGVRMVDGKGQFLPESKRGLPTPWVSFCKMSGLSSLFPNSKRFGQYHLGYLNEFQTHQVPVLAGAFMWMPREVVNKVGGLDDTFFMYGEDIDLSYRITQAGYENYYFADTTLLHYKGESTKKGSLNYIRIFYKAMQIFADKHFSKEWAGAYKLLIVIAVWLKAGITLLQNWFGASFNVLVDALLAFVGLILIKNYWATQIKLDADYYNPEVVTVAFPLLVGLWLISIYFSGGYDKPQRYLKTFRGGLVGTLIALAIYGVLPDSLRFSRAILVLGGLWLSFSSAFYRWLKGAEASSRTNRFNTLIVGSADESNRVQQLLQTSNIETQVVGHISEDASALATPNQLQAVIELFDVSEVIFCLKDVSIQYVLTQMQATEGVNFKTVPHQSESIIGSNDKNSAGDFYAPDHNLKLAHSGNRRNKRVLDVLLALLGISFIPLWFYLKRPTRFVSNCWQVLIGGKTWVGYQSTETKETSVRLPKLKAGVLQIGLTRQLEKQTIEKANLFYARHYSVYLDWSVIWKHKKQLDNAGSAVH